MKKQINDVRKKLTGGSIAAPIGGNVDASASAGKQITKHPIALLQEGMNRINKLNKSNVPTDSIQESYTALAMQFYDYLQSDQNKLKKALLHQTNAEALHHALQRMHDSSRNAEMTLIARNMEIEFVMKLAGFGKELSPFAKQASPLSLEECNSFFPNVIEDLNKLHDDYIKSVGPARDSDDYHKAKRSFIEHTTTTIDNFNKYYSDIINSPKLHQAIINHAGKILITLDSLYQFCADTLAVPSLEKKVIDIGITTLLCRESYNNNPHTALHANKLIARYQSISDIAGHYNNLVGEGQPLEETDTKGRLLHLLHQIDYYTLNTDDNAIRTQGRLRLKTADHQLAKLLEGDEFKDHTAIHRLAHDSLTRLFNDSTHYNHSEMSEMAVRAIHIFTGRLLDWGIKTLKVGMHINADISLLHEQARVTANYSTTGSTENKKPSLENVVTRIGKIAEEYLKNITAFPTHVWVDEQLDSVSQALSCYHVALVDAINNAPEDECRQHKPAMLQAIDHLEKIAFHTESLPLIHKNLAIHDRIRDKLHQKTQIIAPPRSPTILIEEITAPAETATLTPEPHQEPIPIDECSAAKQTAAGKRYLGKISSLFDDFLHKEKPKKGWSKIAGPLLGTIKVEQEKLLASPAPHNTALLTIHAYCISGLNGIMNQDSPVAEHIHGLNPAMEEEIKTRHAAFFERIRDNIITMKALEEQKRQEEQRLENERIEREQQLAEAKRIQEVEQQRLAEECKTLVQKIKPPTYEAAIVEPPPYQEPQISPKETSKLRVVVDSDVLAIVEKIEAAARAKEAQEKQEAEQIKWQQKLARHTRKIQERMAAWIAKGEQFSSLMSDSHVRNIQAERTKQERESQAAGRPVNESAVALNFNEQFGHLYTGTPHSPDQRYVEKHRYRNMSDAEQHACKDRVLDYTHTKYSLNSNGEKVAVGTEQRLLNNPIGSFDDAHHAPPVEGEPSGNILYHVVWTKHYTDRYGVVHANPPPPEWVQTLLDKTPSHTRQESPKR